MLDVQLYASVWILHLPHRRASALLGSETSSDIIVMVE